MHSATIRTKQTVQLARRIAHALHHHHTSRWATC
jgi:hypothetical protein